MKKIATSDIENIIDDVTNEFLLFAKEQPKSVYLASIVPLILENNISDAFLLAFKTSLFSSSKIIGDAMAKIANSQNSADFFTRFIIGYNHFLVMWQHCNPPPHVHKIMIDNQLGGLIYNFENEFRLQMHRLWDDLI
ncbi:MAG: hypothetical protein HRU28_17930 [Rhizobiales bacterium]|nr:hypothetical protein [Hyphomicrobiales bacterium]